MEKNQELFFEQGLLDLNVELSTKDITAGNEFAIFVLVKNPFSKPIWIREVNVSLPSELKIIEDEKIRDLEKIHKGEQEEKKRGNEELGKQVNTLSEKVGRLLLTIEEKNDKSLTSVLENLRDEIRNFRSDVTANQGIVNMTIKHGTDIGALKIASNTANVDIGFGSLESGTEDKNKKIKIQNIEIYDPLLYEHQVSQVRTIKLKSSLPEDAALQPGSTAVYTVVLNVKKSLVFTPSKYRLLFYVNYVFNSKDKGGEGGNDLFAKIFASTIAHEVAIRPSVYSVIVGSVIGGVSGSLVKILQDTSTINFQSALISIILATILSTIAVVFMVRKSDAQSFVSVEDFWGGILIGFLVGYSGITFFEGLAGITNP
jgi:hypothetical protein